MYLLVNEIQDNKVIDHFEELRKRLIIVLLSVSALTIVSFFLSEYVILLFTAPARGMINQLYFFSPYEAFMVKLKISLAGGVVLGLPVIVSQLWQFVVPALYVKEQKVIAAVAAASVLFFFTGVLFAYFLVIPLALKFFLSFKTPFLFPLISFDSYISFFLSLLILFGIAFDLPVLLVGLMAAGIVPASSLNRQRRIFIILIFVLAAVLTPTTDVLTQCLLSLTLWLLFELAVWLGRALERKNGR